MRTRKHFTAFAIAAALSTAMTATLAQPQTRGVDTRAAAVARVESFSVVQIGEIRPGTELEFMLSGTPGRHVTVQIAGATAQLPMSEVRPGRYEGTYTVRSRDGITAASLVTARLEKDGDAVTAAMDRSVVRGAPSPLEALPKIVAFVVAAPEHVRPGDELTFSMTGSPGGQARAVLSGVDQPIPLSEVSAGVYEGNYTLKRMDRPDSTLSAGGFLVVNGRESSQRFQRDFTAAPHPRDPRAQPVQAVPPCLNCGVVEAINVVDAKGDGNNVVGTIAGGVLGGVLGHQVGGGSGKDLATIAGALGGAYAGNRVQNNMAKTTEYHVVVRLESGTTQTVKLAADPAVKVGERVKVENNTVVRRF